MVKSVCQKNVVTIDKNATLSEASRLMHERHVGSLVVVETYNGKKIPSGIITDRDIALALHSSPRPQNLPVHQIMRPSPIVVKADEGIFEATVKMHDNGVKRLPVIDDDESLCGIVCADDLLSLMAREIFNLAGISESQIGKEKGVDMPVARHIRSS